jgi:hypothetical protein
MSRRICSASQFCYVAAFLLSQFGNMRSRRKSKNTARGIDESVFICRGKTTMSDREFDTDSGAFSYGVGELRTARAAQELSVCAKPQKAAKEVRGFDPYNTSGSFDRKKNWTRVGKR